MNYFTPQNYDQQQIVVLNELKKNRNWYFALGVGLMILGMLAAVFSVASTLVSIMYLGALMVVAGCFEAAKAVKMANWSYAFLHAILSVLYIIAGVYMFINPEINALTFTLFLAAFFVVAGIMRIGFACTHAVPHKGWVIANGAVSIFLGVLIWKQWPESGLWLIGTFVGIELFFTGLTWIMLASKAKQLTINDIEPVMEERDNRPL